jgi:hypothetical protein
MAICCSSRVLVPISMFAEGGDVRCFAVRKAIWPLILPKSHTGNSDTSFLCRRHCRAACNTRRIDTARGLPPRPPRSFFERLGQPTRLRHSRSPFCAGTPWAFGASSLVNRTSVASERAETTTCILGRPLQQSIGSLNSVTGCAQLKLSCHLTNSTGKCG